MWARPLAVRMISLPSRLIGPRYSVYLPLSCSLYSLGTHHLGDGQRL